MDYYYSLSAAHGGKWKLHVYVDVIIIRRSIPQRTFKTACSFAIILKFANWLENGPSPNFKLSLLFL